MTTATTTDITTERLRVASEALDGIDLRTLRGEARDDVRDARVAVRKAIKTVGS